jgi:hypothetical protein
VDIIGQNQALDLHAFREEPTFEIHRLMKIHGAVVIPVNEQDRRLPRVHGGDWRRLVCDFQSLPQIRLRDAVTGDGACLLDRVDSRHAVMYAVEIDARSEHVRIPAERQRGQIAAE